MGADRPDPSRSLYVHLLRDGGIFLIRGDTGQDAWVTQGRLIEEVQRVKSLGGAVVYSREEPDVDPPAIVTNTFRRIAEAEVPVQLLEQPHPAVAKAFKENATTLMAASHEGDLEIVSDLIARGADLEAKDADGYTALMYACNRGQADVVRQLLQAGADVDAADNQNSTPLMFAAQHDYVPVVRMLIEAGASHHARGDHGMTALGLAKQNGHRKTRRLLTKAGAIE